MSKLIGTIWQHQKRKTSYRIIGVIVADLTTFKDMDEAYWCGVLKKPAKDSNSTFMHHVLDIRKEVPSSCDEGILVFAIPIRLQLTVGQNFEVVVLYQDMADQTIWGRPQDEFTDGRFVRIRDG